MRKKFNEVNFNWFYAAAVGWIVAIILLMSVLIISYVDVPKLSASQQEVTRLSKEIERLKSAPCECNFVATWDGKMCKVQRVPAK